MKKGLIIGGSVLFLVCVVIGSTWISAYNGAIKKEAIVNEDLGNVHASLTGRY